MLSQNHQGKTKYKKSKKRCVCACLGGIVYRAARLHEICRQAARSAKKSPFLIFPWRLCDRNSFPVTPVDSTQESTALMRIPLGAADVCLA